MVEALKQIRFIDLFFLFVLKSKIYLMKKKDLICIIFSIRPNNN